MTIERLHFAGYRSLRHIELGLGRLTVVQGGNGTGKSNLYNALRLLAAAARGELARALAAEGGMPSMLWAGGERKRTTRGKPPVRATFTVQLDEMGYALELGLPIPSITKFQLDPQVKEEAAWIGARRRPSALLLERAAQSARLVERDGSEASYPVGLLQSESALAQVVEPRRFPELAQLRDTLARWRFYHHFRSDAEAPVRQPQVGVRTPVLSDRADDLAAALQTIIEIGDAVGLHAAIDDAFPGASLGINEHRGWFDLQLELPGVLRPLSARELSDGTLRYLCLLAALGSPRPPAFLVLNEPETSLHPDLLGPLAARIVAASGRSQVLCTTHSMALAEALSAAEGAVVHRLQLVDGETVIEGAVPWAVPGVRDE